MLRSVLALLLSLTLSAHAGQVQVAAAANLAGPLQKIAAAFQRETGHVAVVALGSTGRFHAQVRNGAPFEVLLAADAETPRRLEAEGLARAGTRFTYAIGRLVLWSAQPGLVDAHADVLRQAPRGILAIADPRVAPYGAAAVETLKNLGLLTAWERHFAHAENIAQAYQFAASGNAQIAFVSLSQVTDDGTHIARGSGWIVPANLHAPIRQDAVLLNPGAGNPAAAAFLAFLRSDPARTLLRASGYGV
ncbi:MAG: molybdate-binding periplasmic protein precursor [Ramlibacter sp.]|jgi:molybdate transport system substrate-binding protein|nr:molybdate-binding periplasmic protein precursor [Ramlibacter sp.]